MAAPGYPRAEALSGQRLSARQWGGRSFPVTGCRWGWSGGSFWKGRCNYLWGELAREEPGARSPRPSALSPARARAPSWRRERTVQTSLPSGHGEDCPALPGGSFLTLWTTEPSRHRQGWTWASLPCQPRGLTRKTTGDPSRSLLASHTKEGRKPRPHGGGHWEEIPCLGNLIGTPVPASPSPPCSQPKWKEVASRGEGPRDRHGRGQSRFCTKGSPAF